MHHHYTIFVKHKGHDGKSWVLIFCLREVRATLINWSSTYKRSLQPRYDVARGCCTVRRASWGPGQLRCGSGELASITSINASTSRAALLQLRLIVNIKDILCFGNRSVIRIHWISLNQTQISQITVNLIFPQNGDYGDVKKKKPGCFGCPADSANSDLLANLLGSSWSTGVRC